MASRERDSTEMYRKLQLNTFFYDGKAKLVDLHEEMLDVPGMERLSEKNEMFLHKLLNRAYNLAVKEVLEGEGNGSYWGTQFRPDERKLKKYQTLLDND